MTLREHIDWFLTEHDNTAANPDMLFEQIAGETGNREIISDLVTKLFSLQAELAKGKAEIEQWKKHLHATQQIAHVGSWELDISDFPNITALYWSDEYYKILGYNAEEVIPASELFFSRVHPEDVQMVQNELHKAIETGSDYNQEHRLLMPDGTEKPVYRRATIVNDPQTGKPVKLIGTIQDLTGRKIARKKLEKANNELRTLFHTMQEVFFSVDMESYQLLQISNTCERVYGYSVREFVENPNLWFELILEEDKHIIYANNAVMYAGNAFVQEYRIHQKDGSIRWLETSITPTLNKEGKLTRIDGITSDITKRKEAELALKYSEEKFRFLIQHSSDVVMINNLDSKISYVSDSISNVTGYSPEEVINKHSFYFVHPDDISLLEQYHISVLNNPGKPIPVTYRRKKKDGDYIWCEGTAINLLYEDQVKGIVINLRDVTERKNYEEALKLSNEELKKSNAELDRFVYSVSHDLRAPLCSMLGILEIAEAEVDDNDTLEYLSMLKSSIKKQDGFICDILDYSRNSRLGIKREEIDFDMMLEDIVNNLKYMNASSNADIRISVQREAPYYSDRSRIQVVLNNLVSNALRYSNPASKEHWVDITIGTAGNQIKLTVKDNGVGIGKKEQKNVFNMFYRISKDSVGSGLGLYIVKETVDKLQGTIKLISEPGVGTEFTILIPNLINTK